jgi:hypothetical protein
MNSEIVHITREQNTEIAWAFDSRKNHIQQLMFSKLHVTVDYGSLGRHSLGSVHSSCENEPLKELVSMNFIPFRVFSMRVFVNATASPLLN